MKDKILKKLRESGGYVSGQELSEELGVSRTAVWKAIERLREQGYPIEAVTNKGYRLSEGRMADADLLNQSELEEQLVRTVWAGHPVVYKETTGSTNSDIMELADRGAAEGTLVVSTLQTQGRGRRGRTWISPAGDNIYMSILLRPKMPTEIVPMVTLIMALSICEAANEALGGRNGCRFGIKWPNDLVACSDTDPAWKKCVGILTEMRLEETEIRDVTIGDGLNIRMTEIPEEIRSTATSFCLASGGTVKRAELVGKIWQHFEEDYAQFLKAQSFAPLRAAYEALLVNRGRRVRVLDPKEPFDGTACGISDRGELAVKTDGTVHTDGAGKADDAVRTDGGEIRYVSAGEVSVRGVEGYV
jgi:BirA family biotin operon repressor/biotin-[acetyl-CoA-carboxylase] ligase